MGIASRRRAGLLAALLLLSGPAGAQAPAPEAPEAKPSPPTSVPLAEVASRAEDLGPRLAELGDRGEARAEVQRLEEALEHLIGNLGVRAEETREAIDQEVGPDFLADLADEWRARQEALARWIDRLTERATELQQDHEELEALDALWSETRRLARAEGAPPALRELIAGTLEEIQVARKRTGSRRDALLTLQARASEQLERVDLSLKAVAEARETALGELLSAGAAPIWSERFRQELREDLAQGLTAAVLAQRDLVGNWLETEGRRRFVLHAVLGLLLYGLLRAVRRRVQAAQEDGPGLEQASEFFEQPLAIALLVTLLGSPLLYGEIPRAVQQLLFTAVLLPAVLLLRRVVPSALLFPLHGLVFFFLTDRVRQALEPLPSLERLVFLVELGVAVGALLWLGRRSRLAQLPPDAAQDRLLRRAGGAGKIAFGLLLLAFLAVAFGFSRFGRLVGEGVLESTYVAIIAYALVRLLRLLLRMALRVDPLRRLGSVRRHRALLEARCDRLLRGLGYAAWGAATLGLLELWRPFLASLRSGLEAQLSLGAVSVRLGDLVIFGLTVWVSFLLARALRFVLEEEVFPRTTLRRGMPYAVSTLSRYVVLLLGFLLAVAAAGINLDRLAFLVGALGVGIGFGLQNVVNNFISGLILLFERPIQLGDTVEIGGLWAEVRRIGIRSSVVRTFDGAEVIVPNGDLISQQVTNWTLSDRHRRVEVRVGVAYGTDPERVLEILARVAAEHEEVLDSPEPRPLFEGFGDSSLDFRLLAWVRDFDRGLVVRSDLTVAVNRALAEAGITIPFPQRDLHLIDVPGPRGGAGPG